MPATLPAVEDLMSMGAGFVLALEIEGIMRPLAEWLPKRCTANTPPASPSGWDAAVPALLFDDNAAISIEVDADLGFGRGDALEFALSWEVLEAYGLTAEWFSLPTKRARLVADVGAADTMFDVTGGEAFAPDSWAYIGRETVRVSTPMYVTRAAVPYRYKASSPTTFGIVTDKPVVWMKRDVTLHLHVLTPEGRMLDEQWFEGTFHRILWRGQLDEQPKPDTFGMKFRALPLVRKPGEKLGHELAVEVVVPDPADDWNFAQHPIVSTPEATLTIEGEYSGGGGGTFAVTVAANATRTVSTMQEWCEGIQAALETALAGEPWYQANTLEVGLSGLVSTGNWTRPVLPGWLLIRIPFDAGGGYEVTTMSVLVPAGTYWLAPCQREGRNTGRSWIFYEGWPAVQLTYPVGSWLPVVQTSGEGYADVTVPDGGVAVLEVDGQRELVRWDEVASTSEAPNENVRLLHITQRGVAGTPVVDLSAGAELKFVSGDNGTPAAVTLRLLQSSGTGLRGDYDTLGLGLGLGIPSAWIDEESFTSRLELNEESVAIFSDGKTSLEELVGGWFALQGLCVVQRTPPPSVVGWEDRYELAVVRVDPSSLPASGVGARQSFIELDASDLEMGTVGVPDSIEAPTEVRVSRSGVDRDRPDVMPQDVPAIQALGQVTKEFSAPGMSAQAASDAAWSRIAAGFGKQAIELGVMPWLRIYLQPGDMVKITAAHPATYDWRTGTRAPSSIAAVVRGQKLWLKTHRLSVTFALAGLAPEALYLGLGSIVAEVYGGGTAFRSIARDEINDNARFAPSGGTIKVTLYNPGNEATELDVFEVVPDGDDAWVLASGTLPAWVEADKTLMTFGPISTGDPELEDSYLYLVDGRRWSA